MRALVPARNGRCLIQIWSPLCELGVRVPALGLPPGCGAVSSKGAGVGAGAGAMCLLGEVGELLVLPEPTAASLPGLCPGCGLCLELLSFLSLQPFLGEPALMACRSSSAAPALSRDPTMILCPRTEGPVEKGECHLPGTILAFAPSSESPRVGLPGPGPLPVLRGW